MVRVGVGLGASALLIADCRCLIVRDRGPVTGSQIHNRLYNMHRLAPHS